MIKTLADDACRAEILRRLKTVRPESTRRWGRMSSHQMICHLTDGFKMAAGEKRVPGRQVLAALLVKWIVLYGPLRWPTGVPTSPELDQTCGGTPPATFAEDLAALERLLMSVSARGREDAWPPHPVFGRMSRGDWLRWGYLHTDHHLRQFGA